MTIKAHVFITDLSFGPTDSTLSVSVRILGAYPQYVDTTFTVDKALTNLQIQADLKAQVKQWTIDNWSYSYGLLDTAQLLLAVI